MSCPCLSRAYELDKDGFYKNYVTPLGTTGQPECCEKHTEEAVGFHERYAEFHAKRKETDLRGAIEQADLRLYRNGFMPRNVLQRIALLNLIKRPTRGYISTSSSRTTHRFDTPEAAAAAAVRVTLLESELEHLLDQCVLDSREQSLRLQWAGERERRSRMTSNAWHGQENNPDLDGDGRSVQLLQLSATRRKETEIKIAAITGGGTGLHVDVNEPHTAEKSNDNASNLTIVKASAAADMIPMYDSNKFLKLVLTKISNATLENG